MSAAVNALNPFDDNWQQNLTIDLFQISGDPVTISLEEICKWIYVSTVLSLTYAIAIGLCSTLLVVMLFVAVSDRTKLRRPIFLLNILSLFLVSLRGILAAALQTGPFEGFAQVFLDVEAPNGDIVAGLVIVHTLIQLALHASILATLTLQVRVMFSATKRIQKIVTIVMSIAAIVLLSLELSYCVIFITFSVNNSEVPLWMELTIRNFFIIFVSGCSLCFLLKLALTIRQRKGVGIIKFGPLQVLFIMSCQCLVGPRNLPF
jgi:pheromone alpha factor receptor